MSVRAKWGIGLAAATCIVFTAIVYSSQTVGDSTKKNTTLQTPAPTPAERAAQTPEPAPPKPVCKLTAKDAPDVSGLRFGMTPAQVLALFPGSEADAEIKTDLSRPPQFGVTRLVIMPAKYKSKDNFPHVSSITVGFMEGRLSDVNVSYGKMNWAHVDEFVEQFSEGKKLPPTAAWEDYVGMENQLKNLNCPDFQISVYAGGPNARTNYIQMKDLLAEKELKARRAKAREKAEKEAKPQ